jgi:hypothetical protein
MNVRPFVYHLAEAENWPSIQRDGLFSTRALLERAGIDASIRAAVEREHRPKRTILSTGLVIRDQKPIPPAALQRCLVGLTATQWYELENCHRSVAGSLRPSSRLDSFQHRQCTAQTGVAGRRYICSPAFGWRRHGCLRLRRWAHVLAPGAARQLNSRSPTIGA